MRWGRGEILPEGGIERGGLCMGIELRWENWGGGGGGGEEGWD